MGEALWVMTMTDPKSVHEIERKFLITKTINEIFESGECVCKRIEQRYLDKTGDWAIRIRRVTQGATSYFLTMKKKITMIRSVEIETKIDADCYEQMATQCGPALRKTRYCVQIGEHLWEIDVFDDFDGLVIAEVELRHEDEDFVFPDWLGIEVTEDHQYKNRQLAKTLEKRLANAT